MAVSLRHHQLSPVRTVSKALDILECLSQEKSPLSAGELAKRCSLSRPTAYRLLTALAQRGYIAQDRSTRIRYRLGYKVLELSKGLLDGIDLRQCARPYLKDLSQAVGETVHLAVLDGASVVYIDKVEGNQTIRMHSTIGSRNPAHCTALGKAILAHLPADERSAILAAAHLERRTPQTITDTRTLEAHLAQVRQRGFAIDNVENEDGIRCVGAPIFDHTGRVIAALSISGPAYRLTLEALSRLGDQVKGTAAAISRELGYLGEHPGGTSRPPSRTHQRG
jgi:DNA-binding IclR family transcriptional regulator